MYRRHFDRILPDYEHVVTTHNYNKRIKSSKLPTNISIARYNVAHARVWDMVVEGLNQRNKGNHEQRCFSSRIKSYI